MPDWKRSADRQEQVNWNSFTKAELIRTIKQLDRRQTKLLNRIAELESRPIRQASETLADLKDIIGKFPWEPKQ